MLYFKDIEYGVIASNYNLVFKYIIEYKYIKDYLVDFSII